MRLEINRDLRSICREIVREGKSSEARSEIESDDIFQRGSLIGGFDATEMAFCFEITIGKEELWFQFDLAEAEDIAAGRTAFLEARLAEH